MTLAETLINDAADLGKVNTLHQDSPFVRELPGMIQKVASDYMRRNIDLNDSIYKTAKEKNLNDDQIQRLVEESNNQVYMAKYASMKGNRNRDVKFKLADAKEIKARLNGSSKMEKKASVNSSDDVPVFQGGTFMKYASIMPEKKPSIAKIAAHKAMNTINGLKKEIDKIASEVCDDLSTISQSLILQEQFNKNAQEIFNDICKKASWSETCMDLCISSVGNNMKYMKANREINDSLDLQLSKFQKTASFDMGKYSFNKQASYAAFSPIYTPNGNSVKDVDMLVKIACEIEDKMTEMSKIQSKLKYVETGLGLR